MFSTTPPLQESPRGDSFMIGSITQILMPALHRLYVDLRPRKSRYFIRFGSPCS